MAAPDTCPHCASKLPFRWFIVPSLREGEVLAKRCPHCRSWFAVGAGARATLLAAALGLAALMFGIALLADAEFPGAGIAAVALGALLGYLAVMAVLRRYGSLELKVPAKGEPGNLPEPSAQDAPRQQSRSRGIEEALLASARTLEERYDYAYPMTEQVLEDELFRGAVRDLTRRAPAMDELVRLARDNRVWLSQIALEAMSKREDVPDKWRSAAIRRLDQASYCHAGFFLRSLYRVRGHIIGAALAKADQVHTPDLVELIKVRMESGLESFDLEQARRNIPRSVSGNMQFLLDEHSDELPESFLAVLGEWLQGQLDLGPDLAASVNVWSRPFITGSVMLDAQRRRVAAELTETIRTEPGASAILIGEPGVGKTTVIRQALLETGSGWSAFEASASTLNAGAMWVGQLEGRVEEIVSRLEGKRVVWVFPDFQDALFAGAYVGDPRGLLDALLLHVEQGRLRLVAELTPSAYELLVSRRPRIASAFKALRLHPLDGSATLEVCRSVAQEDLQLEIADEVLRETIEYGGQFFPSLAQPGAALKLLKSAAAHVREEEKDAVESSDVLATLSTLTGIPTAILDPSRPLGLDRVKAFLSERVLGQEEAVEALVERIALVKAGLTDPTRPLGVFLFVGPTGTGKTELAKALAELVFGSQTRLLRLDMSEYQTPDALERLLSDANIEPAASPLIAGVRRDPFSVVLLDEFEKAAAPVHDLFLALFDDGRLTDRSGQICDFRHCLVIMTSNVGAALRSRSSLGFDPRADAFSAGTVERALERAFRPEFLNRIDRVLVFRPFEREQMRALLEKEIDDVRRRRGLRDRPWAIEFDESASEFLIERGFSPTLGARPLKRAVEQHVLAPLACAIADAQVPTGDQFLFLSAKDGTIAVEFVGLEPDDDAAERASSDCDEAMESLDGDLRRIVRVGVRRREERQALLATLESVHSHVTGTMAMRKGLLLAEMQDEGFWERPERQAILAEIEYLDRLEAATATARRLGARLLSSEDAQALSDVGELLAIRVYVLREALTGLDAGMPYEVFLSLRSIDASEDRRAFRFFELLQAMYESWAKRRGMSLRTLMRMDKETLLHVSGLGASVILTDECGLHVLEIVERDPDGSSEVERATVAVAIAPAKPDTEIARDAAALIAQGRAALESEPFIGRVVRRYRLDPDPLVRDAVRGYRTGRVERVLAGDFDLY